MSSARVAWDGRTLETRKTFSLCPAMTRPIISSEAPLPYISAVSIKVMPRDRPVRNAFSSSATGCRPWAKCQDPMPSAGALPPCGSPTIRDDCWARAIPLATIPAIPAAHITPNCLRVIAFIVLAS